MQANHNILLLGGSNTVIKNGLTEGLRSHGDRVINLGLGNSGSLQNLYELINILNGFLDCDLPDVPSLQEVDLIVTESFLNDVGSATFSDMRIEGLLETIELFYYCLYLTGKRVVVLFLPFGRQGEFFEYNYKKEARHLDSILAAHKQAIAKYGFNFIDVFDYYKNHGLFNVFSDDLVHENPLIMFKLGSLVAQSFGAFFSPKPLDLQLASEGRAISHSAPPPLRF